MASRTASGRCFSIETWKISPTIIRCWRKRMATGLTPKKKAGKEGALMNSQ